jgi:hypothetical protein
VINFPASQVIDYDINGNVVILEDTLGVTPSIFELVAIDNRGEISRIERRYFFPKSRVPIVSFSTSKGPLHYRDEIQGLVRMEIGQGARFEFSMDGTRLVGVTSTHPWYYEYRLYTVTEGSGTGPDSTRIKWNANGDSEEWFSTKGTPRVDEVVLNRHTNPPLLSNFSSDGVTRISATILEVRVRDVAGVYSDVRSSFRFYVNHIHEPEAMFYPTHIYVLGEHHWVPRKDNDNIDTPPFSNVIGGGQRWASNFSATPIMRSRNNEVEGFEWAVVADDQTRFWFRWGFAGEFAIDREENDSFLNNPNSPEGRKTTVLCRHTGKNYLSEITHFHLQLNNERFDRFPPLLNDPTLNHPPGWLRIPANHEMAQRVNFGRLNSTNGSEDGGAVHVLRVRAEDLQGVISEPAEFRFRIISPTMPSNNRVLYISNVSAWNPDLMRFYNEVMPSHLETTFLHRGTLANALQGAETYNIRRNMNHIFPHSFLNQFKYVIYAVDTALPTAQFQLGRDIDGLRLYMRNNPNIILVGSSGLDHIQLLGQDPPETFFSDFFGFPRTIDNIGRSPAMGITGATAHYAYFIGANPVTVGGRFQRLNPVLDGNPETAGNANVQIARRRGLLSYTFFTREAFADSREASGTPIYLFDCKGVNADPYSPRNNDERAIYQGQVVGIRQTNGTGFAYAFGFSLYHIEPQEVRRLLTEILQ